MNAQAQTRPVRHPMIVQNRLVNPVVRVVLRGRAHGLLSRSVALITVTGRRSGRRYTTPVMYARDGDDLYVYVGLPDRKTWWRNLREPQQVRVVAAGREFSATARLLDPVTRPEEVRTGLRAYARTFPRVFRRLGMDPEGALAPDLVMVRLATSGSAS